MLRCNNDPREDWFVDSMCLAIAAEDSSKGTKVASLRRAAVTIRTILISRRFKYAAIGLAAFAGILLVALAAMPWGSFKSLVETRLSKQFGRPVTIERLERLDSVSLWPTIAIHNLRVPQASWAGTGDLLRLRDAQISFPVMPLLVGQFRPSAVTVAGVRVLLVRDRQGRNNWPNDGAASGGSGLSLIDGLSVTDALINYSDDVQNRHLAVRVTADPADGIKLSGSGTIRGAAVTLAASAPAVRRSNAKEPWPFRAEIDGTALAMNVTGSMDRPLDTRHMTLEVKTRAADLKLIDAVIEAGLIGTQDVRMTAHARRDDNVWKIDRIRGLIGQSDIAGKLTVTKGERTKLKGTVVSNQARFDDFASDAGLAKAIALEREQGLKIVPNMRVNIRKIDNTDGVINFTVRKLVGGRRPSSLTSLSGTVKIDHQLMTVPLTIGLRKGKITGTVTVNQQGGRPVPLVTLDLTLRDSSVGALAGDGDVDARVDGRVRLSGFGSTIREAVGNSHGTIGLAARNGVLPAKIASLIGFDIARGVTTDEDKRTGLRCAVARFVVDGGIGHAAPLTIDTTLSQSNGTGTLSFPSEALALTLTGAPKQKSVLRLPGSASIGGTLRAPDVVVPKEVGNIFKAIGRSISGKQGPRATDADCGALIARALR